MFVCQKYIFTVAFLAVVSSSHAASFNCERAMTLVEKAICSNTELSLLDDQMGIAYKTALQSDSVDVGTIRQDQKSWLNMRNACTDLGCLEDAYKYQLATLSTNIVTSGKVADVARPLLVLDGDSKSSISKDTKMKRVEFSGTVGSFHDAAGGNYGLVVGNKSYTIRYIGFLTDEQSDVLEKLEGSHRKITVKGILAIYKDGSAEFSDTARIVVY